MNFLKTINNIDKMIGEANLSEANKDKLVEIKSDIIENISKDSFNFEIDSSNLDELIINALKDGKKKSLGELKKNTGIGTLVLKLKINELVSKGVLKSAVVNRKINKYCISTTCFYLKK